MNTTLPIFDEETHYFGLIKTITLNNITVDLGVVQRKLVKKKKRKECFYFFHFLRKITYIYIYIR